MTLTVFAAKLQRKLSSPQLATLLGRRLGEPSCCTFVLEQTFEGLEGISSRELNVFRRNEADREIVSMWLFKRFVPFDYAAADLSRLALHLPRRLRDRVKSFGVSEANDAFELEGIGFIFSLIAIEIQSCEFDPPHREKLFRQFVSAFSDEVLRRRLTLNLYRLHQPLKAVSVRQSLKSLRFTSHEALQLSDLVDFLQARHVIYQNLPIEQMIGQLLKYLEYHLDGHLKLSLAVFVADTRSDFRDHLRNLSQTSVLVD